MNRLAILKMPVSTMRWIWHMMELATKQMKGRIWDGVAEVIANFPLQRNGYRGDWLVHFGQCLDRWVYPHLES